MKKTETREATAVRKTNLLNLKFNTKNKDILLQRSGGEKILYTIVFVFLAIYAITLLYPLIWMVLSSLKARLEFSGGNPFALPEKWLFSNYATAIAKLTLDDGTTFIDMIWNSAWYTVLASGLSAFMCSVTGYCISKYDFRAKPIIYGTAIFCMTVPIVGSSASYFRLIGQIHMYDTPLYVIVTHLGSWGGNFLIMYAFFKNISWNYSEAVFMDGGSHFTAFFKIMLPMAKGPIVTLFIMSFIGNWNDYSTMILYLPSYQTLASGLYTFQANMTRSVNYPVYFAGLIISIVPIVIIFVALSDRIMTNLSVGGLKG